MIGKWHPHEEPATFDYYCVLPGQGWYANPVFLQKGKGMWPTNGFRFKGYDNKNSEDAAADLSLAWLERRDKSRALLPHVPLQGAAR